MAASASAKIRIKVTSPKTVVGADDEHLQPGKTYSIEGTIGRFLIANGQAVALGKGDEEKKK
jgi:hypothetical protein